MYIGFTHVTSGYKHPNSIETEDLCRDKTGTKKGRGTDAHLRSTSVKNNSLIFQRKCWQMLSIFPSDQGELAFALFLSNCDNLTQGSYHRDEDLKEHAETALNI